jgi:hypothetical protein
MIIYIVVAVVVVVLVALVLRPGTEVNGGSLELFLGENKSEVDEDRKNAEGEVSHHHDSNLHKISPD